MKAALAVLLLAGCADEPAADRADIGPCDYEWKINNVVYNHYCARGCTAGPLDPLGTSTTVHEACRCTPDYFAEYEGTEGCCVGNFDSGGTEVTWSWRDCE